MLVGSLYGLTDSELAAKGISRMQGSYLGDPGSISSNAWANPSGTSGSSSSMSMTGSSATPPARIPAPGMSQFQGSQEAQAYPTWLRNLGETQAQKSFQTQVNQGIGMGNAAQGYQAAEQARNMARLGYMSQAGKEQLGVDLQQSGYLNDYQKLLSQLYGIDVTQRGQDIGLQGEIAKANASMYGKGGYTLGGSSSTIGGVPKNQALQNQGGGYIPMGMNPGGTDYWGNQITNGQPINRGNYTGMDSLWNF